MVMEVYVKGVKVKLTEDQLAGVEKELRRRARYRNSFSKILKYFGFTKVDTSDWCNKKALAFEHETMGWFAEVIDNGACSDLWMVGNGLPSSGFPGGHVYGHPSEVEDAICNALDKLIANNK
jgi:hypothetical protein